MIDTTTPNRVELYGFTLNGIYREAAGGSAATLQIGAAVIPLTTPQPLLPEDAIARLEANRDYPSSIPGALLRGHTHLVKVPGCAPLPFDPEELAAENAKGLGWRDYAVISGYTPHVGTIPIGGWLVSDAPGQVWLCKHSGLHGGVIANRNVPFTISLQVLPFGRIGEEPALPVTITATCDDLQQRHPDPLADDTGDSLMTSVHSVHPNGRDVLIAIYRNAGLTESDLPCGWLRLELSGEAPGFTAALSVYKSREQALGEVSEVPQGPIISGNASILYFGSNFEQQPIPGLPESDPRRYVVATLTDAEGPNPEPTVAVVEYQAETTRRIMSVAFRADGSICELAVTIQRRARVEQAFTNLSGSGVVRGIYRPSGGSNTFTEVLEPINVSATRVGVRTDRVEYTFYRDSAVVDSVVFERQLEQQSAIAGSTDQFLLLGTTAPPYRLDIAIPVAGGAELADIFWRSSLTFNGAALNAELAEMLADTSAANRVIEGQDALAGTFPQKYHFVLFDVLDKKVPGLAESNSHNSVGVSSATNHAVAVAWANCAATGVASSGALASIIGMGDHWLNPEPTTDARFATRSTYDPWNERVIFNGDRQVFFY